MVKIGQGKQQVKLLRILKQFLVMDFGITKLSILGSIILIVSSMHFLATITIYRVFYKFLGLNQSFPKETRINRLHE